MCGIAGAISPSLKQIPHLKRRLEVMNKLQKHRGPDGEGVWTHEHGHVGFAHRRLSIIDLTTGQQPMNDQKGNWITYNGEIYNYLELREELGPEIFMTTSDTEVILQAYRRWGTDCVNHLRGMFAFALWDEANQALFCARDRFGIKPFYYTVVNGQFYFASEVKALLPFLGHIETDREGLTDYLIFQFCMAGKTLFKGINELLPGHFLRVKNGSFKAEKYWEVYYELDYDHTPKYFEETLQRLLLESVRFHLRSDVPVGTYLSGGLDSSVVTSLASKRQEDGLVSFHGKFLLHKEFDESQYAHQLANWCGLDLHEIDITASDFIQNIRKVIYHMDFPAAGPGSFPQYMVSKHASHYRKVLLGGQGGDEIFGGYARYLMAYFEQCIKAAIDGTMHNGNFIVTYESIIPNLTTLQNYKPLLKEFWREGLFEDMDRRYFRLINRASLLQDEVNWEALRGYSPFETFRNIFNGNNVQKESYFDLMTHFDFKTLLPALLQVEDRVSMAHGIESRVPYLDHPLVEFAATIPSNIKFKDGTMKQILKKAMQPYLPDVIVHRKDKMGFPTPLSEWVNGEANEFVRDIFTSRAALNRELINNRKVLIGLSKEVKYGRKIWGMLCLELWQQEFHDKENAYKQLINGEGGL
jgi:asparagine synthase (glutamine-hydrolysing)